MGSCADTVSFVFSFVLSFVFFLFCGVSGVPFTDVLFCYGSPPGHWKVHKRVIRGFVGRFSWIGVVCCLKGLCRREVQDQVGKFGGGLPGMIAGFRYPFFPRVSLVRFAESRDFFVIRAGGLFRYQCRGYCGDRHAHVSVSRYGTPCHTIW